MSISAIVNKPTALVTINYPQGFAPSTGFGWGGNARGQIGDASTTQRVFPVTTGHIFTRMDGGWRSSIGLKADGTIWCWGHNGQNQLGDGTTTLQNAPQKIPDSGPFVNSGFSDVMHGGFFAAAVKTNGEVWAWGNNQYGNLGDGTTTNRSTPVLVSTAQLFVEISGGTDTDGGGGGGGMLARTSAGAVFAWGASTHGHNGTAGASSVPVAVVGAPTAAKIESNGATAYAIDGSGNLYSWGLNDQGQVARTGAPTTNTTPTLVSAVSGVTTWLDVSAGWRCVSAIGNTNFGYGSGFNSNGQLGTADILNKSILTLMAGGNSFSSIKQSHYNDGASYHAHGITSAGVVWSWGSDSSNELGDDAPGADKSTPVTVNSGEIFYGISRAGNHQLARKL